MNSITRRQFLTCTGYAAGALAAVAGAAIAFRRRPNLAPLPVPTPGLNNVGSAKSGYRFLSRFSTPRPDTRRLVCAGDRLFVAGGNYISLLDPRGRILSEVALSGPARGVAVAPDNFVFAALRDHIQMFDANGKRVAEWKAISGRPWLTGIAVLNDEVFAADAGNRVIHRFARDGKLMGELAAKDPSRGIAGLIVPSPYLGIAAGSDGLLRVNNPGRHQIETYGLDGTLKAAWGKAGATPDAFCGCCNPIGVAVLPDGRCATAEKGLPRIKLFSARGEFHCLVAGPEFFKARGPGDEGQHAGLDLAADAQGRLYIADLAQNEILVFEPEPVTA